MSKRELIDRIRVLNPTAPTSFLAKFPEAELNEYLSHLVDTSPSRLTAMPSVTTVTELYRGPRQLAMAY